MRIDKYLKVSRIIKRRTVAKEVGEANRIYVNDILAKPSKLVKIGDVVTLHLGLKIVKFRITSLINLKDELMYELINN